MNHLYDIKTYSPECSSNINGSIDITDNTPLGSLSFTWPNLPVNAKILNDGKSVSNLDCGTYLVEIYDLDTKVNKKETIEIKCKDILSLDMISIEGFKCSSDIGELSAAWSGGKSPYKISINSDKIISTDKFLNYPIKSNIKYNLIIKDNNNCTVSRNNIIHKMEPLKVFVEWTPIAQNGLKCSEISCTVEGGKPPYTIGWFEENNKDKPIIVNQRLLQNKLSSGHYYIMVTDHNGCVTDRSFYISEPPPIRATTRSSADYHTQSFFPEEPFNKVYNLLLIPKQTNTLNDFYKKFIHSDLVLKHKNQKINQNIVFDHGYVTISDVEYMYFYINPGLSSIRTSSSELLFNDEKIELYHNTNFNNQAKLIIGSAILDKNYEYLFHDGDLVEIASDTDTLETTVGYSYTKTGLYISPNISTVINFLPNYTTGILEILNDSKNLTIKCLTTKSNSKKGEILVYISGGDKDSIRAELLDSNNQTKDFKIDNNYLHIKQLGHGNYKLKIFDDYNICKEFNGKIINDGFYDINIYGSFDEEQVINQQIVTNKYRIPENMLNQYNNIPNKLLFTSPEFENGVLINISPAESCFEIRQDGKLIVQDCGYKIIDLDYGKYNITVFCDNYITIEKDFFINNKKDLVTILLERKS